MTNLYSSGIDGPVVCTQCKERYCLDCPENALSVGSMGQIVVSPTVCTLCQKCERNCPIGAIEIFDDIVYVCDLCGGSPKCTEACTEAAITFVPQQEKPVSLEQIKKETKKKKLNTVERRAEYIQRSGKELVKKWRD